LIIISYISVNNVKDHVITQLTYKNIIIVFDYFEQTACKREVKNYRRFSRA